MLDFILAGENLPFSIALAIMFCIAALEGVGALMGFGVSAFLESILPDLDFNIDAPDVDSATTLSHFISWLKIGKVPFLILIIAFLTSFGIVGFILQKAALGLSGHLMPNWLAVMPAFFIALPCMRVFGDVFAKIVPQDETEAVSEDSFVGRIAVITLGTARAGSPAEARLKDEHQQSHYIMVEPDNEDESFETGAVVLVVSKTGTVFKAIRNQNKSLV